MRVIRRAHPGQRKTPGPEVKQGEVKWGERHTPSAIAEGTGPRAGDWQGALPDSAGGLGLQHSLAREEEPTQGPEGPKAG